MSQADVETELKSLLGIKKVIWLEGIKGKDITDGHTDFYARFSNKGRVLVSRDNYKESYDYQVTRQNIKILKKATDVNGNNLMSSLWIRLIASMKNMELMILRRDILVIMSAIMQ